MKHLSTLIYRSLPALLLLLAATPMAYAQAPAWQTAVGTAGTSISVKATAAAANDEVIVAGDFANTATFGNTTLTSTGTGNDGFVAKWSNSAGRFVWVQQISGTAGGEYVLSVAVSGSSIYIGGVFSGRMATIGTNFLTNADVFGNNDLFFAKIADAGTTSSVVWAQRAGGQGSEELAGLVATGSTLYAAGTFRGSTTTLGTISLSNASTGSNIFITKITDAGSNASFTWAQQAGGSVGVDLVKAIAVNGNSMYIAGQYSGASTRFGSTTLPNAGNADLFVAKLTDAGNTGSFMWAQQAGGTGYEVVNALAVEGSNVYLTGYFGSPTLTIGGSTLTNAGSLDLFVAKLTDTGSAGSFVWGQQAGGSGSDIGSALAVRGSNVYVTGYHSSPDARFGSTSLATAGQSDVFLTKLTDVSSTGSFAWTQQASGPGLDNGVAVVLQGSRIYVAGVFDSPSIAFGSLALTKPGGGYGLFLASLTDATLSSSAAALSGGAFAIFPNPARTTATIVLPPLSGTPRAILTLTDGLGRVVRTEAMPLPAAGLRHELSVTGLLAGLYALRITAGPTTTTRHLAVEQ